LPLNHWIAGFLSGTMAMLLGCFLVARLPTQYCKTPARDKIGPSGDVRTVCFVSAQPCILSFHRLNVNLTYLVIDRINRTNHQNSEQLLEGQGATVVEMSLLWTENWCVNEEIRLTYIHITLLVPRVETNCAAPISGARFSAL
jgi:hypothetical protein